MRAADKFTLVRIIYAPIFLVAYLLAACFERAALPIYIAISVLLIFAEFTDYLDGSTARRLNQVSDTGKLLDPFADALLHVTTFFCFSYSGDMPAIVFMLIFYREFGMLFLRLNAVRAGTDIAARIGGKLKTVLYIVTGFWTLALKIFQSTNFYIPFAVFRVISLALYAVCVIAAYVSFCEYVYSWRVIKK